MSDPFDLSKMALDAKLIAELMPFQKTSAAAKLKRRSQRVEFVMLPYAQTMAVAGKVKSFAALAVMVELAYQVFKTKKTEVVLSNFMLHSVGISHKAKLRALRQLENRWHGRGRLEKAKKPLVTILWAGKTRPWTA